MAVMARPLRVAVAGPTWGLGTGCGLAPGMTALRAETAGAGSGGGRFGLSQHRLGTERLRAAAAIRPQTAPVVAPVRTPFTETRDVTPRRSWQL